MKRAKRKGPFVNNTNISNDKNLPIFPRNFEITSNVVGLTGNVYSGKSFIKISLTDEMIGHKIGEFVPTREKFVFKKKKKK